MDPSLHPPPAQVEAAVLSDRYIADRFLPGGCGGAPAQLSASHLRLATVTPPSTHPVPTQYSHSTHTVPTQYPHSQDLASSGWTCWKLIPLCVLT